MVMWMKARLRPDLPKDDVIFTPERIAQYLEIIDDLERKYLIGYPEKVTEIVETMEKLRQTIIERSDAGCLNHT